MHCHVVNLQQHLLGAEVYTLFFARALRACGCEVTLHAHPGARHWETLRQAGVTIVPTPGDRDIAARLNERSWIVTHAPVSAGFVADVRPKHLLTGFCHMPLAGRRAGVLADYHLVYAVSEYVISTLAPVGITSVYREPFYGVADFGRFTARSTDTLRAGELYTWDTRKVRDRLLSLADPLRARRAAGRAFTRRPGVTLGIVSAIGPIKQFDRLFTHVAHHLAARTNVHLEIFGSGGYRSVADLKRSLKPLGDRARFWGRQSDPERLYPQLDYLMSGLPEKEALGLNIIEAQVLGTPVLAVNAPPFTETVADGRTGYLYRNPREDDGADFARVMDLAIAHRPDPRTAADHLERFSQPAFEARVARMIEDARTRL